MTEIAVILVRLPCEYWSATAAQKLTRKVPSADFDIQNGQVLIWRCVVLTATEKTTSIRSTQDLLMQVVG
jgi:hypothetical protein